MEPFEAALSRLEQFARKHRESPGSPHSSEVQPGEAYQANLREHIWDAVIFKEDGELKHTLERARKPSSDTTQQSPNQVEAGLASTTRHVPDDVEAGAASTAQQVPGDTDAGFTNTTQQVPRDGEARDAATAPGDFQCSLDTIVDDRLGTIEQICDCFNDNRCLTYEEENHIGEYGDDDNKFSIFYVAVCRNQTQNVKLLLKYFTVALDTKCGFLRRTAFSRAVCGGQWPIVSDILGSTFMSSSQYINIGDRWGDTPLHDLVWNAKYNTSIQPIEEPKALLKSFLSHGAYIDALNDGFRTPLHVLADYDDGDGDGDGGSGGGGTKSRAFFEALLEGGAEVNTKDVQGMSADSHHHVYVYL